MPFSGLEVLIKISTLWFQGKANFFPESLRMVASLCAQFVYDWETYIVSEYMYISLESALKNASIFPVEMRVLITWIKGAVKKIWNLPISSSSHENNLRQISQCNTFYFLRCAHMRCYMFVYKHSERTEYVGW